MKKHAAPIIAAILLLLLPALYVGSYFVLVKPFHRSQWLGGNGTLHMDVEHYRWGGKAAANVFWPLEQIDRKLRPGAWEPGWSTYPPLGFTR